LGMKAEEEMVEVEAEGAVAAAATMDIDESELFLFHFCLLITTSPCQISEDIGLTGVFFLFCSRRFFEDAPPHFVESK